MKKINIFMILIGISVVIITILFIMISSYTKLESIKDINIEGERYKKYNFMNYKVKTDKETVLYYKDNIALRLNKSLTFDVVKHEENKNYVYYKNKLYYLLDESTTKINNTYPKNDKGVIVIGYHFIVDPKKGEKCDKPNKDICKTTYELQKDIDFFKKEGYFMASLEEVEQYLNGEINLPEKTIAITLDDGWYAENAKKVFDRNKVNATVFIISAWYNKSELESKYFHVHSHTDNLHDTSICPESTPMLCEGYDTVYDDLKLSKEKLNTTYISYPFSSFNDRTKRILKELGYTMAFTTRAYNDSYFTNPGDDIYELPRYMISGNQTVYTLDNIMKNEK